MKEILYHGSNVEFDEFDPARVGDRLTSLGLGHYLTTDKEMASDYGSFVMKFEVDMINILDWDNLTEKDRNKIELELLKVVPDSRIAHFGEQKVEVIKRDTSGKERFQELKELTKDAYNDYAKARILTDDEIEKYDPDLLVKLDVEDVVVGWRENGSLKRANYQQLMTLMNEYHPNLAKELGYKGSRTGKQIAIYDYTLAKRIKNVALEKEIKNFVESKIKVDKKTIKP